MFIQPLNSQLRIQDVVREYHSHGDAFSDLSLLFPLLEQLEKILMHELKAPLFGTPSFWDYVKNLERCAPGTKVAFSH